MFVIRGNRCNLCIVRKDSFRNTVIYSIRQCLRKHFSRYFNQFRRNFVCSCNVLAELFDMCFKEFSVQIIRICHLWFLYLKMSGRGVQRKTTALLFFLLWFVKSLSNLRIVGLLIILRMFSGFWEFHGFRLSRTGADSFV